MSQRERDLQASLSWAIAKHEEARRHMRFWALLWLLTFVGLVGTLIATWF